MKLFLAFIFTTISTLAFSQLEFTKQGWLHFVGGQTIIASLKISPFNKDSLQLNVEIIDNWVVKETINTIVVVDTSSIKKDKYFIKKDDKIMHSYKFINNNGFEFYIGKELWNNESYDKNGKKNNPFYMLSLAQLILPENKKWYVNTLPIMHYK